MAKDYYVVPDAPAHTDRDGVYGERLINGRATLVFYPNKSVGSRPS